MFIPDLEVEANAPGVNDVIAAEETMRGTPALKLRKLVLCTKINLTVRKKSVGKVISASAITKIKHLLQ